MQIKYNRFKITILLSIVTGLLWAQSPQAIWILNTDESSSTKNYVARDAITLKADETTNFRFSAAESGKTFNAKIDAGLLFVETPNTYKDANGYIVQNSSDGAIVGSIPGSASVSPSGAAAYQIPIEVPVGINGMQPQISVVYNSQGGFGALGQGWDIAGVSAITRGGKSIYYDNQNNTVKFDNTDALYLDGQRLIYLSGGTGNLTSGAMYATEEENYARIVFNGSSFTLTTVDGKTMEYGVTTNSRLSNVAGGNQVLGWKLNKMTDTYGNSVTYTYTSYGQYLSLIAYAGQTVEFAYNHTMQVAKKSYISSFLISQTKLLTSITTKSGSTVLNTVGFTYKSTSDNRLDKVSLKATDNSKVNETVVNWGSDNNTIQQVNVGYNPDQNLGQNGGSVYSADMNGDGYADRIELWSGSNCDSDGNKGHVIVRLFNPTNKQFNSSAAGCYYFCPYDDLKPKLTVGDINNDGKDEIILYKKDWLVVLGLSNNTLCEIYSGINLDLEDNHQGYNKNRKYEIFTTNINNDNYLDVVMVFGYHFDGFFGWNDKRAGYVVFTGGANGLTKIYDVSYDNDNAFEDFKIGDFNADGKMDVVGKVSYNRLTGIWNSSTNYDTNYIDFYTDLYSFSPSTFSGMTGGKYTADFNGDGKPENLYQLTGNNGSASYLWGFGNPFSLTIVNCLNPANNIDNPEETYQMYPIDYNGDGLVDLIQGDEVTLANNRIVTNWHFYKNLGDLNFQWEKTTQLNSRLNGQTAFLSDINGDGIADLVFPSSTVNTYTETICPDGSEGGLLTAPLASTSQEEFVVNSIAPPVDNCYDVVHSYTTYEYSAFTMFNANRRNVVTSITNGMGQTESFTYKSFSDYDQTATTGVVRNLKVPILLAETHTDSNGSITTYTFEKPKIHTEGKGFLGFSTVTAANTTKNIKTTSNYEIEPTYFGVNPKTQISKTTNNLVINRSKQYNGIRVIDSAKKRFQTIVTAQWSYDSLKNVSQTTRFNYSAYPTITQTTEVKDSLNSSDLTTTTVTNTFTGPEGCLFPYLPATTTTTRTQNGESATRVVSHSYEYNGMKIMKSREIADPDNTLYTVTTEYSNPDQWGHMQIITVTAPKDELGTLQSRSSSVSYTPSGRFMLSKTNALNETTTYNWNETLGLLDSEKTVVNGKDRITSYTYNAWRQLVETRHPDGIRVAKVVQWNTDNTAQYYTYSESSGGAPVWVYYDNKGRVVRKETKGLNGNTIRVFTTYRADGKVDKVSEPTFNTTFDPLTDPCASYGYNTTYGYPESVTTPLGTTLTVYDKLKTTVSSPEGTSETVTNAVGQTMSSTVNGKKVDFAYYPTGLTKTTIPEGGLPVSMKYNVQGKRTLLIDPDGGTVRTEHNGFGELTKQVQKVHMSGDSIFTTSIYKPDGRLESINRNNEITTYTYDSDNKSRVNSIAIANKNTQTFEFDELDRVIKVTEDITANGTTKTFVTKKQYDALGRIKKETYPSGYYTVNTYDGYGNLTEVRDEVGAGHSIWKVHTENALGQATSIYKGGKETTYGYDPVNHQVTSIQAAGVIDYSYGYYTADGTNHANNLEWRADGISQQSEHFIYDTQNRLINWDVTRNGNTTPNSMSFDDYGNITHKSDLGNFILKYGGETEDGTGSPGTKMGVANGALQGPHALTTISGVPAIPFPQTDLMVTYTDFKKIKTLTEDNKYYELTYGVDDQRRMSLYKVGGVVKLTRYYLGNYEEEINPVTGNVRKIHYLSGAILIQNSNSATDSLLYTYSDAQGSLIALTNVDGGIVRRYAYDPWGKRRDASNWNVADNGSNLIINRGYTGHEHIDAFGIINMNGRVYDPYTAMFFSPDPFIQAPGDWLNYNRYGYCYGNPFKYTDPSGELQLGLFYISLNVGWSPYGGLSLGLSAGIGLENWASVGIGVNYGFKNSNWSFTANAGFGGGYAYAGYDTKGGFISGTGYSFTSLASPLSPISFNTNMTSIGIDYSERGGFSSNFLGMSISKTGVNFNPSIGMSATALLGSGETVYSYAEDETDMTPVSKDESCFQSTRAMTDELKKYENILNGYEIAEIGYENETFVKGTGLSRIKDGRLYHATTDRYPSGAMKPVYKGFKTEYHIYMSPHKTVNAFKITLNHELIHIYHHQKYGFIGNDSEYVATAYSQSFDTSMKNFYTLGRIPLFDIQTNLLPVRNSYIRLLPHQMTY